MPRKRGRHAGRDPFASSLASMRPGHCAPEKAAAARRSPPAPSRFNEAGALCPGKGPGWPDLVLVRGELQ